MNTHSLKILPVYFEQVMSGNKTFEVRKNDRDFKEGDIVILKEFVWPEYTGREEEFEIGFVLPLNEFLDTYLPDKYVVFSLLWID